MQGEIFFSDAKKGYNKDEVQSFIKKLDEENSAALQRKADEQKRLLNEKDTLAAEYLKKIAALEKELAEKSAESEQNAAKYEALCAEIGKKLLLAERQAAQIVAQAQERQRKTDAETARKAEKSVAAISACARADADRALRAAEVLRQKAQAINAALEQTKRVVEDALSQIGKAAKQ